MRKIHTKDIPNLPFPNENVKRQINFYGINVDGYEDTVTIPYSISYIENGEDVSKDFEKQGKPMQWTNNQLVYRRNLQTGQPIPNPLYPDALASNQLPPYIPNINFVSEEDTPNIPATIPNPNYVSDEKLVEIGEFLTAPAFDYFITLFHDNPELFWIFLDMYINENYGEGWYGSQSRSN